MSIFTFANIRLGIIIDIGDCLDGVRYQVFFSEPTTDAYVKFLQSKFKNTYYLENISRSCFHINVKRKWKISGSVGNMHVILCDLQKSLRKKDPMAQRKIVIDLLLRH